VIWKALRHLFCQFSPRVLVLGYHRVADLERDHYQLCVSPDRFEEHLRVLKCLGCVVPLDRIVRFLHYRWPLPRCAVALTFDDGYADNLHEALPQLQRFGMPATFYVFTGWIGTNRESWWDDLERMVLAETELPDRLTIPGHEGDFETIQRKALFERLYTVMINARACRKQQILDHLHSVTGISWDARPTHRAMTEEELQRLAAASRASIGFHTVTHPWLPGLTETEQREEMVASRTWLENAIGKRVSDFSYPHGGFTEQTAKVTAEVGARSAVTVKSRLLRCTDTPLQIPRFMVHNWTGDEFSQRLNSWIAASEPTL
jgi:peptidoglycan/xylan/chitin deacetylase (PgdA/CDA1 family)